MTTLISTNGSPKNLVAENGMKVTSTPVLVDISRGMFLRPEAGDLRNVELESISIPLHQREEAAEMVALCEKRGIKINP